jgi:protein SCO1/2
MVRKFFAWLALARSDDSSGFVHQRLALWLTAVCLVLLLGASTADAAGPQHPASGLVLRIDQPRRTAVISCKTIPGYMEAMTMSLSVPDASDWAALKPGTMVDFVLTVDGSSAHASSVHPHVYQGLEPDPAAAHRLRLLANGTRTSANPVSVGAAVPDFVLTGQDGRTVQLSRLRGKIVALNFVYTRCALPNFCVRSTNNFGTLQTRFRKQLKKQLVLLTVTFDPVHDSPEALRDYAQKWKADPRAWHFLTGSEAAIRRVCDLFREDYFPDEGLMDHSLHTVIIDRQGRLVANLEGNEFTAQQLGDLVQTILAGSTP